uniref:Uncharacterized protein n=1 Tax=Oryza punctata TaxID=4537 RepID=A0A0E0MH09_ORYPU
MTISHSNKYTGFLEDFKSYGKAAAAAAGSAGGGGEKPPVSEKVPMPQFLSPEHRKNDEFAVFQAEVRREVDENGCYMVDETLLHRAG